MNENHNELLSNNNKINLHIFHENEFTKIENKNKIGRHIKKLDQEELQ